MDEYVLSRPDHLTQSGYFVTIQINEVIFAKRRLHKQRVQWTAQHHFAGCFGEVITGPGKGVDVHMEKRRILLTRQYLGILNCVPLQYVELYYRPGPDFIYFRRGH